MVKDITKFKHRFPLKQIRQIPKFLGRFYLPFILFLLCLIIGFLNYEKGTFLIGWDNLQAELNPSLNIKRSLFAVWQEYQSLGLLGGMGHAADLIRQTFLILLRFTPLPLNLFRYLSSFFALTLGTLGAYTFFNRFVFKDKFGIQNSQFASFFGGLFYLLNLATLQTFHTPFETFMYFYGFFPWLLYFLYLYLTKPHIKNALFLFLIALLATPAFYIETLFVVFCLCLIPVYFSYFFKFKKLRHSISPIFWSGLNLLIANLFWLLPVIFYVITSGSTGEVAKINTISTPETYSRNLEFGNLKDLALLKGFWFNFLDLSGSTQKFDYLMPIWRNHLQNLTVLIIGYLSFSLIITGIYFSFKKTFYHSQTFLGIIGLCYFFLLGGGFLINSKIPLVGELFRSPFTKFATPLSFAYAYFFAIGTLFLLDLFTFLNSKLTYYLTLFTVTLFLLIYMSPVFSGNLISPNMRRSIPQEYFELFNFFDQQPSSERIANFPQNNFWGWLYYDWGYRGSGFLWYGLKQPILDRAFDVWHKSSEIYYEEMNQALYSQKFVDFDQLMDKYAVTWLMIDKHVISPDGVTDLYNQPLLDHLQNSSQYELATQYNDKIFIYKNKNLSDHVQDFISLSGQIDIAKPFYHLSLRPNDRLSISENSLDLSASVPQSSTPNQNTQLRLPSLTQEESFIPVSISYKKQPNFITLKLTPLPPQIKINQTTSLTPTVSSEFVDIPVSNSTESLILQINDQYLELQIPAELPTFDYSSLLNLYLPTQKAFSIKAYDGNTENSFDLTDGLKLAEPQQCYTNKANRKIEKIITQDAISLFGTDVVGCLSTPIPHFPTDGVLSYSFTYSSPTNTLANVNLTNDQYNAAEQSQPLTPSTSAKRTRLFASITPSVQQINLILEANQTKSVQEIDYQNVIANFHPLLFSTTAKLSDINNLVYDLSSNASSSSLISVSTPIIDSQFDLTQTPTTNQLFPESRNCDQFNHGFYSKTVSDNGFLYQSQNAISCDYLDLRHLSHSLHYLLNIDYQYQTGLAMTVCLENHTTNRCDIYERLDKKLTFQSLLNPVASSDENPGYTLHLFDQSIGLQKSSSLIKSIAIHPLPLNYLQNIEITQKTTNPGSKFTPSDRFKTTHPAEFLYTVSLPSDNSSPILNLYQSQSPYWVVIAVDAKTIKNNLLSLIFKIPFLYFSSSKLHPTDHVSWYNSWDTIASHQYYLIVYLPQYLEFAGFAALLITLTLFIVILSVKKTTKKG